MLAACIFLVLLSSTAFANDAPISCIAGYEYRVWGDTLKSSIKYQTCAHGHVCVRVEAFGTVFRNLTLKSKIDHVDVTDVHAWKCIPQTECKELKCSDELLSGVHSAINKNVTLFNFTYSHETCKSLCCDTSNCNAKTIRAIKSGATLCLMGTEYTHEGRTHKKMKGTGVCYNKRCYRGESHGTIDKRVNGKKVTTNVTDIIIYGCSSNCGKTNKLICDWNMLRGVQGEILKHDSSLSDFRAEKNCRVECCEGDDCNQQKLEGSAFGSSFSLTFTSLAAVVSIVLLH